MTGLNFANGSTRWSVDSLPLVSSGPCQWVHRPHNLGFRIPIGPKARPATFRPYDAVVVDADGLDVVRDGCSPRRLYRPMMLVEPRPKLWVPTRVRWHERVVAAGDGRHVPCSSSDRTRPGGPSVRARRAGLGITRLRPGGSPRGLQRRVIGVESGVRGQGSGDHSWGSRGWSPRLAVIAA